MKKVCVIGHFAFGLRMLDGQTVKTKIVTEEIKRQIGQDEVIQVDTHGGKLANLIKAPFQAFQALKEAKHVIIFPAHNGLRIFAPLLVFWKRFFKSRKLHYVVIGGWLAGFLKDKPRLSKKLKKFDWIYVETSTMRQALEEQGFENAVVMPNCKKLNILDENELVCSDGEPHRLCTFSRVMKEKGIEDAVNAVKTVNEAIGRTVFELDIYGQIEEGQTEWFNDLKNSFPDYIRYGGSVDSDKSVDTLRQYFALLFPTRFYTEGIPGTIIDAYSAGVPVISSRWASFHDVVDDGKTGIGYEFDHADELKDILRQTANNPNMISDMKKSCIRKAKQFAPETALKALTDNIER